MPSTSKAPSPWTLGGILREGRAIWGSSRLTLAEITIRMTVNVGKLARCARYATKDDHTEDALKLALGNIIASTIRWCDDLGLDPEECVSAALVQQHAFAKANPER